MKIMVAWKDGKNIKLTLDYVDDLESLSTILERKQFIKAVDETGKESLMSVSDISVITPTEEDE